LILFETVAKEMD